MIFLEGASNGKEETATTALVIRGKIRHVFPMARYTLRNPHLRRFWFWHTWPGAPGYGVTAYSLDDARAILFAESFGARFRGIWCPCLNLIEPR